MKLDSGLQLPRRWNPILIFSSTYTHTIIIFTNITIIIHDLSPTQGMLTCMISLVAVDKMHHTFAMQVLYLTKTFCADNVLLSILLFLLLWLSLLTKSLVTFTGGRSPSNSVLVMWSVHSMFLGLTQQVGLSPLILAIDVICVVKVQVSATQNSTLSTSIFTLNTQILHVVLRLHPDFHIPQTAHCFICTYTPYHKILLGWLSSYQGIYLMSVACIISWPTYISPPV